MNIKNNFIIIKEIWTVVYYTSMSKKQIEKKDIMEN